MEYKIALAPNLGVDAEEFATDWNATPACHALAQAQTVTSPPTRFALDPQLVQQGLILLSSAAGAAGALAFDALKDAVKDKLTPKPSLKIEAVRQADGAYLLVVTEEA